MTAAIPIPQRMRRREAARYLGTSAGYLEKAAVRGNGPPYLRVSARLVLYDREDLDRWLAAHGSFVG
jgi:excisionase family DNA binding protein